MATQQQQDRFDRLRGAKVEDTETVTFEVTPARAEYLRKCLERPLCLGCRREQDECDADPCLDARIENGELAHCTQCNEYWDPKIIEDGVCEFCRGGSRLFEVTVSERISYSIYVEAINEDQARQAVEYMDTHDWEGPRETCDKYGFNVNDRDFDYDEMEQAQVEKLDEDDVIPASEWVALDKDNLYS